MQTGRAIGVACRGALNHFLQNAPAPIRRAFSKPTSIYIMITRRCNLRCTMCGIPLNLLPEITVQDWKRILDDIADWAGGYCKLQFSGGEPLLYDGFFDVLEHCVKRGLLPGFCTNATRITEDISRKTMTMGLENINISLDGIGPVHDAIRGEESFQRTDEGIRMLVAARKNAGVRTPIILKTCLMGANAADVPNLLKYTEDVGADKILFQPMEIRQGDGDEDWDGNEKLFSCDWSILEKSIDLIAESRAQNGVVMNSPAQIRLFKEYFKNPRGQYEGRQMCTVGDSSLLIHSDGSMEFCGDMGNIGNALETPPSVVWKSKAAEDNRKRIYRCTKGCLQTCYANKTLKDKAKAFLLLVRGSKASQKS